MTSNTPYKTHCLIAVLPLLAVGCQTATPLFNGKDLAGWTEIGSTSAWSVDNGVLKCTGEKTGYAWLCTDEKYADFVLTLDYKIAEKGNSGVFCRVPQHDGRSSMLGFETQLTGQTIGDLTEHSPGSIFQRAVASSLPGKPGGQWNQLEITCNGNQIIIKINGTQVVDVDKSTIENFKDVPDAGFIGLQNHGDPVEFRNVRVRLLNN
jgi:hypothetical protein